LADQFPASPNAAAAQVASGVDCTLEREPGATALLADHVQRYPLSPFTPDAIYWLGRLAEEAGTVPLARGYYKSWQNVSIELFREPGRGAREDVGRGRDAILRGARCYPAAAAIANLVSEFRPQARDARVRADGLRSIGFDASAELELRAGYAAPQNRVFLLEAAQAAMQPNSMASRCSRFAKWFLNWKRADLTICRAKPG